jgi:hypothetical protein
MQKGLERILPRRFPKAEINIIGSKLDQAERTVKQK